MECGDPQSACCGASGSPGKCNEGLTCVGRTANKLGSKCTVSMKALGFHFCYVSAAIGCLVERELLGQHVVESGFCCSLPSSAFCLLQALNVRNLNPFCDMHHGITCGFQVEYQVGRCCHLLVLVSWDWPYFQQDALKWHMCILMSLLLPTFQSLWESKHSSKIKKKKSKSSVILCFSIALASKWKELVQSEHQEPILSQQSC